MNKVEYLHMMQQSVKSGKTVGVSVLDMNIALEEISKLQTERDELIEMLKETLKYGISDSRRKAAYDLVVMLGGYQGKTDGQTDDR